MKNGGAPGVGARLCCGSAERVRELVALQAEDEGIWFHAGTCAEAYLQAQIRNLHAVIEDEFGAS